MKLHDKFCGSLTSIVKAVVLYAVVMSLLHWRAGVLREPESNVTFPSRDLAPQLDFWLFDLAQLQPSIKLEIGFLKVRRPTPLPSLPVTEANHPCGLPFLSEKM